MNHPESLRGIPRRPDVEFQTSQNSSRERKERGVVVDDEYGKSQASIIAAVLASGSRANPSVESSFPTFFQAPERLAACVRSLVETRVTS